MVLHCNFTKKAALLPPSSLIEPLLRRVIRLDGLRLDDHAGVGFLPVLGLGGDGSCHVARTQPQRNRYACHNRRGYGNNDFVNLLFAHHNLTV